MRERLITHLRHVDLAVPDYDKQLDFYTTMWGLTPETTDDGLAFLAAAGSPEQYSVRLRRAAEKRLDLIAFGAAAPADVDTLAERLGADGVQLVTQPAKLRTPGGGYGFRFYQRCLDLAQKTFDLLDRATTRVAIPFEGSSLPAYFTAAGRAHPAFEKRLALCVAWGANHDWGAVQKRRLEREGERPVPHYWDHVLWVWGETDLDS